MKRYRYIGFYFPLIDTVGVVTYIDETNGIAHYRPDGIDFQVAVPLNELEEINE